MTDPSLVQLPALPLSDQRLHVLERHSVRVAPGSGDQFCLGQHPVVRAGVSLLQVGGVLPLVQQGMEVPEVLGLLDPVEYNSPLVVELGGECWRQAGSNGRRLSCRWRRMIARRRRGDHEHHHSRPGGDTTTLRPVGAYSSFRRLSCSWRFRSSRTQRACPPGVTSAGVTWPRLHQRTRVAWSTPMERAAIPVGTGTLDILRALNLCVKGTRSTLFALNSYECSELPWGRRADEKTLREARHGRRPDRPGLDSARDPCPARPHFSDHGVVTALDAIRGAFADTKQIGARSYARFMDNDARRQAQFERRAVGAVAEFLTALPPPAGAT